MRNIGIMAHIDAGKTTTTERILFYSGAISRLGEVDDGAAFTDWMEQEQERGISITAASTVFAWRDPAGREHQINLIDTPGHVDFTIEVERCLRVLDGAIAVFSAIEGVQAQSEAVWRQADRYRVPRLAFINKCDRIGADPAAVVEELRHRLAVRPLVLHAPIGLGADFAGVIDLVAMTARTWDDDSLGVRFDDAAIPDDLVADATAARESLLDALAELDDGFLTAYVEAADAGVPVAIDAIRAAIRRATLAGLAVPVVLGAAFRNKGVHNLLDAVVDYLPSPLDVAPVIGVVPATGATTTRAPDVSAPLAALAFKVMADGDRGHVTYVRVYAGLLTTGQTVYNATKDRLERIERLVRMHANRREDVAALPAGAIGAIIAGLGERTATTGDTLCDPTAPVCLDPVHVPEPVIGITVEPATSADEDRLRHALERLAAEDPSFRVGVDLDSGATTIAGMGELHLEILVDRLRREFAVDARVGRLQVAYRETVTTRARGEAHRSASDGVSGRRADVGHVVLIVEPATRGHGFRFENQAVAADVPAEFVPAVAEAAAEAASIGVVAGFPMTDLTVSLVGGSFHVVDSSQRGYKLATTRAFRDAAVAASPTILEPVMELEVRAPDEHTGDVLGELLSRRAKIAGMEARPGVQVIAAAVPLAEMFGYASVLRSTSRGRGTYSMRFAHYAEVPHATRARLAARANA